MNFTRECNYQACVCLLNLNNFMHIAMYIFPSKICTFFKYSLQIEKTLSHLSFCPFLRSNVQHKLLPRMVSYFLSRIWLAIADKSFEVKLVRRTEVTIIILCNEVCRFTWYSPGIHTRPFIFISASLSSASLSTSSKKSAMCLLVK